MGKLSLAAVVGLIVLGFNGWQLIWLSPKAENPTPAQKKEWIGRVIAFDVVTFLLVGLVILIAASKAWEVACICAGACLLGGGLLGLLFGMPLAAPTSEASVAAKVAADAAGVAAKNKRDQAAGNAEIAGDVIKADGNEEAMRIKAAKVTQKTALGDAANSLSKLVAGAGLVSAGKLFDFYQKTASCVSAYIDPNAINGKPVLGGGLILYFSLLGLLSGLFLPAYFMKDWQE